MIFLTSLNVYKYHIASNTKDHSKFAKDKLVHIKMKYDKKKVDLNQPATCRAILSFPLFMR